MLDPLKLLQPFNFVLLLPPVIHLLLLPLKPYLSGGGTRCLELLLEGSLALSPMSSISGGFSLRIVPYAVAATLLVELFSGPWEKLCPVCL